MKPFSIIIPTHNNASMKRQSLLAVLDALEAWAEVIQDVVIVDNASTDEGIGIEPRAWRNHIVVTSCDVEPNIAAARNLGACYSRAPYLVFVDDDMLLAGPVLGDMAGQVHEGAFWTCAERRYLPWGTPLHELRAAARNQDAQWFSERGTLVPGCDRITQRYQVIYRPTFIGCFGIVPRTLFEQVGGFDAQFSGWGGEDTDLLARLLAVGPLVSLFGRYVAYHCDHAVSPYKLRDRDNASRRLGGKLNQMGKDFDLISFAEAVVRGEDVSHWDLSLDAQRRLMHAR